MNSIERATQSLRASEASLRELVAEAAKTGDYETVRRLTDCAEALAAMASNLAAPAPATRAGCPEPADCAAALAGRARSRRKATEYPKFFRRGDDLLKVGWSKREKKEYQHKAPRKAVSLVAAAIAKAANGKRLVTTDDFMPLADPADRSEVPDYQAYVCLAWLRKEGLVKQQGRQGYKVPEPATLQAVVDSKWALLPET